MPETTDDERGEGLNECGEAERGAERHPEDAGAQEQREERQAGCDRPHERRQPGDRDAEHQCPLAALGGASNRRADPRRPEEHGDADHGERCDDQRDEVVGRQDERPDRDLPVDRWRNSLRGSALVSPHPRHEQRERGEQLRDADRGHGENESRCLGESTDERQLDDRSERDGRNEADTEAEQVRQPREHDEPDGERRRDEPEIGLGEVDHPVGAIDERHADGEERDEQPEHDAADPGAGGHAEEDELHGHEPNRRRELPRQAFEVRGLPAAEGHPHVAAQPSRAASTGDGSERRRASELDGWTIGWRWM